MTKTLKIVQIVDRDSPGLLEAVARLDGISKEALVRKVLAISAGRMVRTHHAAAASLRRKELAPHV